VGKKKLKQIAYKGPADRSSGMQSLLCLDTEDISHSSYPPDGRSAEGGKTEGVCAGPMAKIDGVKRASANRRTKAFLPSAKSKHSKGYEIF